MHIASLALANLLLCAATASAPQPSPSASAPETFSGEAHAKGVAGTATSTVEVHIQRYTPDFDRAAVETALKQGGYRGFLAALRKAPDVGYVALGGQKGTIRWARERTTDKGRTIVVITDKPVFFVGGGQANAKPRAGYEVAVIQLQVDGAGLGDGTMAAAARVKPGGEAGVVIDDYAEEPIKLVTVRRKP